jgi:hypothetical protein
MAAQAVRLQWLAGCAQLRLAQMREAPWEFLQASVAWLASGPAAGAWQMMQVRAACHSLVYPSGLTT